MNISYHQIRKFVREFKLHSGFSLLAMADTLFNTCIKKEKNPKKNGHFVEFLKA